MTGRLRIVSVGLATSLQDRGRAGLAHLGVPRSGAVDRPAADTVNRLVGNDPHAVVVETLGGFTVEAVEPAIVATSSAGRTTLPAGRRLTVVAAQDRRWVYLASRGGFVAPTLLGSASHDTLSGWAPAGLAPGNILASGPDPATIMPAELAPTPLPSTPLRVAAWPGPFPAADTDTWPNPGPPATRSRALTATEWEVTNDVSRVGMRLRRAGPAPAPLPTTSADLPSFGLVLGAAQLTPAGEVIVMLADHPTTGGYPVIGIVDPSDLPALANAAVGARVRFHPVRPE